MLVKYFLLGTVFGAVLLESEVISWFRIQEMFRFQSFHMYGIMAGALSVGLLSVYLIRRLQWRTLTGKDVRIPAKEKSRWGHRYWMGGAIFGMGWALLGACPGPIFALIGSGETVFLAALASAVAGTWTYGQLRSRLPH